MKQLNKKDVFLGLVSVVKANKLTKINIRDISLIPFVLSFFKQRTFFSVDPFLFDDVVGSFLLDSKGFCAVPFVDKKSLGLGVFNVFSHYDFLLSQAQYSTFGNIDVCVFDSRVLNKKVFKKKDSVFLKISQNLSFDSLLSFFNKNGYIRSDDVLSPGEFAVRGGVVDFFSYGTKKPCRVSFLDGNVSVFYIDKETGVLSKTTEEVFVFPFSRVVDFSLLDIIKDRDLLVSYDSGILSITNNLCSRGDVFYQKDFNLVDFQKFKNNKKSLFLNYSKLLLSRGFSLDGEFYLPFWFKGKNFVFEKNIQVSDFELAVGSYYVHDFFGVCCFLGLEENSNISFDKVCLKFSDGVLKMDVRFLYRLSFWGDKDKKGVFLDFLNKSSGWNRRKKSALKKAEDYVKNLVISYGKRNKTKKEPCFFDNSLFSLFMSSFEYKDTADQHSAWKDIQKDLCSEKPMNRLLCGDVGFGKTEIALRAVFLSVINKKSAVVVAPTTILSKQLFLCCLDRFKGLGFKIKEVSRLTKNNSGVCDAFANGDVDVLVGTHSLSRNPNVLKKAGLFIVDEEHRFGVKDKEFVFSINPSVDFLCMTATPIPRSLQFSLSGIRKISTMLSPPILRKPIISNVFIFNKNFLVSCIKKELSRGGSVFVVDNSVDGVLFLKSFLTKNLVGVNVSFLHGGLSKTLIKETMSSFISQKNQVLVSTSIIESGIDVSSANTIIINNSHMFGLSQLHQLRGRVGRSNKQAFAYFFVPVGFKKNSLGWKRLESIHRFSSLGSGYRLSLCDLEIRGAGSLFGYSQTGSSSVGFDYYSKLIKKVVSGLPDSDVLLPNSFPFVFLGKSFFPKSFIKKEKDRLFFYEKISNCVDLKDLKDLEVFVYNKFGVFPLPVVLLFESKKMSLCLFGSEIKKIVCGNLFVEVFFSKMYVGGFEVLVKLLDGFFKDFSLSYSFIKKDGFFGFSFKKTSEHVSLLKSLVGVLYE